MKKLAGFLAACLLVLIGSQNLVLSQTCPVETQGHQPDYPYANLWCPAKYFTPGRQGHTIKYIVIHTLLDSLQGGINCFYDPGKWCRDPRTKKPREVSAHYLIGKDGSITQMVHEGDTAWHAGNWQYNLESIGIEHEGFVEDPNWATEEMYQASARLVRYLVDKYGIPLENIIGHNQVPDPEEPGKYGGKENHYDPCNHPSWASTGGRCNNQYWKWDYFMQLVRGESPTPPPLDSDNDGIPDSQDRCPYQAGPGWNGGCPPAPVTDSDNDGVPDGQDACPYEPGPSWNNGCPEVPRPTNQPPIARFIFSPANPSIDQPVRFDASSSFDPDPGDYITEYRWDFNDDRIFDADGPIAYHTFSFSASYQVTLMVVDSRGAASFQHQVISVSGSTPPPPDTGPPPPPPPPLEDDSDQDGIPDSQDRCPYQAGPSWNGGCPVTPPPPSSPPPSPSLSSLVIVPNSSSLHCTRIGKNAQLKFRATNTGSTPVTITGVTENSPNFSITGFKAQTIKPGKSKTISVKVQCSAVGVFPPPFGVTFTTSDGKSVGPAGYEISVTPKSVEQFSVNRVDVAVEGGQVRFFTWGAGIESIGVQVWDLTGKLIFSKEESGSVLAFNDKTLANGVYLSVVRVRGFDGREYVSEVRKLVILR